MLRSHFYFITFFFICFVLCSQNYEGKITYSVGVISRIKTKTNEQYTKEFGSIHEFYTKNGNFRSVEKGVNCEWKLYLCKQNKLYKKYPGDKSLGVIDCSTTYEYPSKIRLTNDSFNILGYTCREWIITYKCTVYKFYFSPEFPLNGALYTNNNQEAWYEFVSRSGAFPLQIIVENDNYTLTKTAIKTEKLKVNAALLAVPKGTKLSPVSLTPTCFK